MTSANLPNGQTADKQPVTGYLTDDERRIVGLAAVEEDVSRAAFVSTACLERAVEILKQKNPSALDGTPYEVAKSA